MTAHYDIQSIIYRVMHAMLFVCVGDVRSDIYVTLEQGQFEKGSKRAERNVEVAISVCDEKGQTMQVSVALCVSTGSSVVALISLASKEHWFIALCMCLLVNPCSQ